ncbi:hypothetical protein DE146DRAFT_141026 [Phaeosphaeria sp. MPI-PUGE-AT-0046c]|nr:hypothetical protein DE146DRAFT_141026 [Phaeosphaeria sp. MPI-PUGE-AT-0046c]
MNEGLHKYISFPPSHRNGCGASEKPFPFMKLPTEIRLIIAELALTYEDGLIWHWKSGTAGQRVGHFVTRRPKGSKDVTHHGNAITLLCLSRQLREETSDLWLRNATLYFDGYHMPDPESPPNRDWEFPCHRAVCAYEFFTTHPRTQEIARLPPMILIPSYFGNHGGVVRRLLRITQDPRLSDTRIIAPCEHAGEEAVRDSMKKYSRGVYINEGNFGWADGWAGGAGLRRNWRIWPDPEFAKWIEKIREEISEEQYLASIDYIENGT